MRANEKRKIKGELWDIYEKKGMCVSSTDSADIILFSDRPLTKKSKKTGFKGCSSYITSFGEKEAVEIIRNNWRK